MVAVPMLFNVSRPLVQHRSPHLHPNVRLCKTIRGYAALQSDSGASALTVP